jgi:hypothetical protein
MAGRTSPRHRSHGKQICRGITGNHRVASPRRPKGEPMVKVDLLGPILKTPPRRRERLSIGLFL